MENLIYSQMKPNEQKLCFQGTAHVFWASTLIVRNIIWNFDFLF